MKLWLLLLFASLGAYAQNGVTPTTPTTNVPVSTASGPLATLPIPLTAIAPQSGGTIVGVPVGSPAAPGALSPYNVSGVTSSATAFGAKCDGTTDDTVALTAWAASAATYTALALPASAVCIFDPSNGGSPTYGMNFHNLSHFVLYGNGSTIRAKAGSTTAGNSFLMHFATSTDIRIMDLTLDGNVANRTGTSSYGGDNIFIEDGSARILFDNVHSINAPKDDWDITPDGAPGTQATYPTDITLRNSWGNGAYRNGLSAIGSVRLSILGGQFDSANGTLPEDGIDIEPDSTETYENTYLVIDGVDTSFNTGIGLQITVSGGSGYNKHVMVRNWSAQGNAIGEFATTAVSDLEMDGAFMSNTSASSSYIFNVTSGNGMKDIVLRNLHFDNISANVTQLEINNSLDRVLIDGVSANTVAGPLIGFSSAVTAMNINGQNLTSGSGMIAVNGANVVLKNVVEDTDTGYAIYCGAANLSLDNLTAKDWAYTSGDIHLDSGCTGFVGNNITALQSTAIPGPVWNFTVPPKSVKNFIAHSAGTDYVPAAISGCGTAGTVRLNGLSGTFVVGTGAATCTFVFTVSGSTGLQSATGWIANVDDVTAKIHCPNNGTIASLTSATALCNSTVTTGDLMTFSLTPF